MIPSRKRRLADVLERSLWTLVQTATAGGLIVGWNELDLGPDLSLAFAAPLAFVLSAIKSELATKFGAGTAATLPEDLEPEGDVYTPRRALIED